MVKLINHSIMEHLKGGRLELVYPLYITQTEKNLPENVETILEVEAKNEGKGSLWTKGILSIRSSEFDMAILTMRHLIRRLKPPIHNKVSVTTQISREYLLLELYGEITCRNRCQE